MVKSTNGNVPPPSSQIRIARRRRILGGATTGVSGNSDDGAVSGNSDDGAIIADGVGKMEEIRISRVEVVGDDDCDATLHFYL
nr:hypothetical protein [Tanacetum cinerariifolium]